MKTEIPEDIKQKIADSAIQTYPSDSNVNSRRTGFAVGAEYGYSLSIEALESKEKEIAELKETARVQKLKTDAYFKNAIKEPYETEITSLKQEIERLKGLIEKAWWEGENRDSHTLQLGWKQFNQINQL